MSLTKDQQANVLNATNDFLIDRGLVDNLPHANLATARKVLPYYYDYEEEWKSVGPDQLDKYGKKAHGQFVKLVLKIIRAKRAKANKEAAKPIKVTNKQGQ